MSKQAHPDASTAEPTGVQKTSEQTSLELLEYDFSHESRGTCVIINNKYFDPSTGQSERVGTEVDVEKVESIFTRLGFDILRLDDLRTTDISINLRKVSKEDHSKADCFACVILSHGREGRIYGTDGTMAIDSLVAMFKGDECPSLAGKPKLFFIQACRGTKMDYGVQLDEVDAAGESHTLPAIQRIPVEADFLLAYSTAPGYFSWRNNVDGSWFIQALHRVVMEHGDSLELLQMLTLVSRVVALEFSSDTGSIYSSDTKQMPCFISMLMKQVYFKPKY